MKAPVRVTITGAAGQIGYQLAFRIASGQMLGNDQPVILQLLEIPDDCAFGTLAGIVATDDPDTAFKDADYALLVGARPRGPGMERKDLLEANAAIFSVQGKAMNDHASRDIKVLVVGNPANTNSLIAQANAPDLNPGNFTAMTRLDHNRAMAQLAAKTGSHVNDIKCMSIWGNHSVMRASPARAPRSLSTRNGSAMSLFRLFSSAARPSSRHVAHHPPRRLPPPRSIICMTGSSGQLRHRAWHHLLLSGALQRWRLRNRAGSGDR
jgi:hypothetical protein